MINLRAHVGTLRSAKIFTMILWSILLKALLKSTNAASTAVGLVLVTSRLLWMKSSKEHKVMLHRAPWQATKLVSVNMGTNVRPYPFY